MRRSFARNETQLVFDFLFDYHHGSSNKLPSETSLLQHDSSMDHGEDEEFQEFQEFEWSDHVIDQLHVYLLETSLESLRNERVSRKKAEDIFQWIRRPRSRKPLPFSFQMCCHVCGYDMDELKDMTVHYFMNKVIHLAIADVNEGKRHKEILKWINGMSLDFFSFESCCQAADMNPEKVKSSLLEKINA